MPAIRRRWSTADVRALMDESRPWPRYELIHGELVVTPAPGNRHQLIVLELVRIIADYVDREDVGVAFISPADLELVPDTITQPDVFVVPRATTAPRVVTDGWENVKALLLACEVLSPSSERTDRVDKREYYLSAGVPDYWVVDPDARVFETWTPTQETPRLSPDRLVWQPRSAGSALVIDVPGFFANVRRRMRSAGL